MKAKIALADTFWTAFAKLPKAQSKKVGEFVTKFRHNADSGGINYEKIKGATQDNLRSVRIDQAYRGIVLKPDAGKVFVLLWVDHHDNAYAWARRTKCEIHPETGALQLYETEIVDPPEEKSSDVPEAMETQSLPARLPDPLLNLDSGRLLGIGVPESMIDAVSDLRSISELEAIQNKLPVEAFEALYLFADGIDWDDIWAEYHRAPDVEVDTEDLVAALERDASKRRFTVVDSDLELQEMLAAPLEKWRVYLHPSQRRLVQRNWNGPVRVLGGAGTGKTVVALHRAAWLVRNVLQGSQEKVLFLTFNTNLAQDIRENLAKISSAEELGRIEVINIDAWVSRFLKSQSYSHRIVGDNELTKIWGNALGALAPSDPDLPESFYKEEWERIILPNRIQEQKDYLRISRTGRGVPLNRRQRAALWPVFDEIRSQMQQQGLRTYQDASLDARDLLVQGNKNMPYRSVVVDETQDMGPEALSLIRFLTDEGQNDLFLVGDGHQRIYRKRAVMGQCGINIVGRGRKLKINYRTTEQIRRFSSALLEGFEVDDLDGNEDPRPGYRSLTVGVTPEVHGCDDQSEEAAFIASRVEALVERGEQHRSMCVVLRTNKLREEFERLFAKCGMSVVTLSQGVDNQSVPGIRLATMHRVKGLEFRHMFIAGCCDGVVPLRWAMESSEDPVELREHQFSERALLHVACSRAIESLTITYHGKPSPFLSGLSTEGRHP